MLVLVWIHLLAAVLWIGGMSFLSLALVPVLQQDAFASSCRPFFKAIALRFRRLVWLCILLLLVTGPLLLGRHVASPLAPMTWPPVVQTKLTLVLVLLLLTAIHDLLIGPRVGRILSVPEESRSALDRRLVGSSRWMPRLSLFLALAILLCAVTLART